MTSDIELASTTSDLVTDLVLEGGGVKGIALVGALQPMAAAGYSFARIGGTSAGAIVGAVLAAMQQRGEPVSRLEDIARTLDYRKFRDRGPIARLLGPFGLIADGLSVLFEEGAHEGDYMRSWLAGVLGEFDIETFGDLRVSDPGGDGRIHHRYRLVVTASDVSRKRLLQLPWDYDQYGLDPDEQHVVDAVRASASTPYFFEPVELEGQHGTSTLVDGGLLSNYPISIFDRMDERAPRWPTIGVRLGAPATDQTVKPVQNPITLGIALIETAIEANQAEHVLDPCNVARSVRVDTTAVGSLDYSLTKEQQQLLLDKGAEAAGQFLADWDYPTWLATCRGVVPGDNGLEDTGLETRDPMPADLRKGSRGE